MNKLSYIKYGDGWMTPGIFDIVCKINKLSKAQNRLHYDSWRSRVHFLRLAFSLFLKNISAAVNRMMVL
jgi:hypothetical protein